MTEQELLKKIGTLTTPENLLECIKAYTAAQVAEEIEVLDETVALLQQTISRKHSLITEKDAEIKRLREGIAPCPKLVWNDLGFTLRAYVFKYQFSVILRTFNGETTWNADVFGTPIRLMEKFDAEDKSGAITFCESHWEAIWTEEMSKLNSPLNEDQHE